MAFLMSCREVVQSPKPDSNPSVEAYLLALSPYVGDQNFDFFLENSWYAYDEDNHIIWPNFRVYSLRINSKYYKVQVVDYYDERSYPGFFTLRIEPEGEPSYFLDFEASGCGNVYTNPAYKECIQNPETNVYTYVDIEKRTAKKISNLEAKSDKEWDIAFNGTNVKLNSGTNGPGSVRAANLYLYGGFFFADGFNFQRIAEESFGQRGDRFFNINFNSRRAAFGLPEGQPRAIFESDWFVTEGEFFKANSKNWWIIKGAEEKTYSKFNVKKITEEKVGEFIQTKITLSLFNQSESDTLFQDQTDWELPLFSSETRLAKTCLDLNRKEIVECSSPLADLILTIFNKNNSRRWRMNIIEGAVGPLSSEEMLKWIRGN